MNRRCHGGLRRPNGLRPMGKDRMCAMQDADGAAGQGRENEVRSFVRTHGFTGTITKCFSIAAVYAATAIRRVSLLDCPISHLHNGLAPAVISRALRDGLL